MLLLRVDEVRSGAKPSRWRRLRLTYRQRRFAIWVADRSEVEAIRGVLLHDDYAVRSTDVKTIIDAGGNVGLATMVFRTQFPNAKIVTLEPNPDVFARLVRNVSNERVLTLPVALAGSVEERVFEVSEASWASAFATGSGRTPSDLEAIFVQAWDLDHLLCALSIGHVDVLKLDIEGAEVEVLEGCRQLEAIETIIAEVHTFAVSDARDRIEACLSAFDTEWSETGPGTLMLYAVQHNGSARR